MSAVSKSMSRRVTLGYLASHYGFELRPGFADGVTVTSVADTLDSVRPGSLYVPREGEESSWLALAVSRGAYAMLVPPSQADLAHEIGVPVLLGTPDNVTFGALASDIAGAPANSMALFVVSGKDDEETQADAVRLADFLHLIGNPVGLISASGSSSLERELEVSYPLGILDVQHQLGVCAEDGAAAMVISADAHTLRPGALESVEIDVLGSIDRLDRFEKQRALEKARRDFGFVFDKQKHLVTCTEESGWLAGQAVDSQNPKSQQRLSLAIAMAMDAGVRRGNIRSALRVSKEML
ncbi:hypothetical protein FHX77_000586 [Bifidobacterium commune]|uniref:UDP-N-acetylmuramyl peptide synthase n=1 Tax=Bifidobacterium commune TaxID=1505727 RepID=A0A1C4H019_9BIFI|nr:hypothetical protein [Bifidobacterium commune]MBB2955183.1 hypothetical protein [Bifidobacterium commune]SCC78227.1 hypothetical protein GA0061077_0159 [Bifidobacterium commune]